MANVFRSSRLIYRAIEDTDADFLHSIQANPESFANSDAGLMVPETKANSKEWMEKLQKDKLIAVIICIPKPQLPESEGPSTISIGALSLTKSSPQHRNASIAVDILAGFQGKGYGSEAIMWITNWGFRHAGLHHICIEAFSWNEGANRLYQRLGFALEGRIREQFWHDGGWGDFLEYGIIEHEWPEMERKWKAKIDQSKSTESA